MTVFESLRRGWSLIQKRLPACLLLVTLFDLPIVIGEAWTTAMGSLSEEMAAPLWGLAGVFLMPLSHSLVLMLLQVAHEESASGVASTFSWRKALERSFALWPRYQVAYFYASFLILGWVAITILPGVLVMWLLKISNVWVLLPFGAVGLLLALVPLTFLEPCLVVKDLEPWHARQRSRALAKRYTGLILRIGAFTMPLPLLLEFGASHAGRWLVADEGSARALASTTLSALSAFLYLVPTAAFFALFSEITRESET
jgi:hypothetical protein